MSKKNQGYVSIPREVLLDKDLLEQPTRWRLLVYLYGLAQHKPRCIYNQKGMPIRLQRGQLHRSIRRLSSDLNSNFESIRKALHSLMAVGYIVIHKSRAGNVIEILNWPGESDTESLGDVTIGTRSNNEYTPYISNKSEARLATDNKSKTQLVTEKWLEGYALQANMDPPGLEYGQEIEKARAMADAEGRTFDRGYMLRWWNVAVDRYRAGWAVKKNNGAEEMQDLKMPPATNDAEMLAWLMENQPNG